MFILAVLFSCVTFRQKDKSNVKSNIFSKNYGLTKKIKQAQNIKNRINSKSFQIGPYL